MAEDIGPGGRTPGGRTSDARADSGAGQASPDFGVQALQQLGQRCEAFRQHVREYLERPAAGARVDKLEEDLKRLRNTLVLLERTGAVFVAEELLLLLAARSAGNIDDADEFARVLIAAGERLSDHVASFATDEATPAVDGALALVTLVNDSRTCRGAPLLSEAIVVAAGVTLPGAGDERGEAPRAAAIRETLAVRARDRGPDLSPALIEWLQAPQGEAPRRATDTVIDALTGLADLCVAPTLAHLAPVLDAAVVVAESVVAGDIVDGTAPRRLLARVERWLQSVGEHAGATVAADLPVPPDELQRNLLYYVALGATRAPRAHALHERFALDRIRPSRVDAVGEAALGARVTRAIRDHLDTETSAIRQRLELASTTIDHRRVSRLREHLTLVEPVLTILGAREARTWLRRIDGTLESLASDAPVTASERQVLAESLIRFERALDGTAGPVTRRPPARGRQAASAGLVGIVATREDGTDGHPGADVEAVSSGSDAATRLAREDAVNGCLAEARRRLLLVGESLGAPRLVGKAGDAELELIERALTMIALPDIGPLLRGVRAANARIDGGAPPAVRETLAMLIASLEFYLGRVLDADAGTTRLLHDAEAALARLEARLPPLVTESPAPESESESESESETTLESGFGEFDDPTTAVLACMDRIGEVLADPTEDGVPVATLCKPFDELADIGGSAGLDGLGTLARGVRGLLDRVAIRHGGDAAFLTDEEVGLIEEAHAVLPQLIEQLNGSSEAVRGLDALVQDLSIDTTPLAEPANAPVYAVSDSPFGEPDASPLDHTVQQAFLRECAAQIDTLEQAVLRAGQEVDVERLPSDSMLRALHTLSGCARTVDAHRIVAVVRPLQRVALSRQRVDVSFDTAETRYVGELVGVLRAHLATLASGEPASPEVLDVERRLDAFADAALADRHGMPATGGRRSLDHVFDEEARELLSRLRDALGDGHDPASDIDRALEHLHTLGGSARMAGRHALAERAHALEGRVQEMPDTDARHRALLDGRRELQALLLDTMPRSDASLVATTGRIDPGLDDAGVPTVMLDILLSLATDVTAGQARLGAEVARMREICRDLESAASRRQRLPQDAPLPETPAMHEMLADLDTARIGLNDALGRADVEQRQAASAASSLHQTLMRTRLIQVESLRERLAETAQDAESMRPVALVVDDSITMRVAAADMLGQHGIESREARDGTEALDSLARGLPNLMILDLDMPRPGGFELIRRLRERHGDASPPVIVVTGRDDEKDRDQAAALGVVRYLTKPYSEEQLHDALLATGLRLPDLTIA